MNPPRFGDEHSAGSITSLLAPTGSPTLGAATFLDVTVSLLPEFAMNRADDADLGVRVMIFDSLVVVFLAMPGAGSLNEFLTSHFALL